MTVEKLKEMFELMDDDVLIIINSEGRSKADSAYMTEYFGEKLL